LNDADEVVVLSKSDEISLQAAQESARTDAVPLLQGCPGLKFSACDTLNGTESREDSQCQQHCDDDSQVTRSPAVIFRIAIFNSFVKLVYDMLKCSASH
jgi:hypothetical protein